MRKHIIYLLLCLSTLLTAQEYKIQASLTGAANSKISLAVFRDLDFYILDTAIADAQGKVNFRLPATQAPGMLKVIRSRDAYTDLLFNKEDIVFETVPVPYGDSVIIHVSDENKAYYDFLNTEMNAVRKLELLTPVLDYYPQGPFYDQALSEYMGAYESITLKVREICQQQPKSLVCPVIRLSRPAYVPPGLRQEARMAHLRDHYFDGLNMNDTSLLRTSIYADKVLEYISLFGDRNLTQSALEKRFVEAIDRIMFYVEPEQPVYAYIVQYLVNGFERYKFETVLNHLAEKYVSGISCEEDDSKRSLERRLESFKRMAVGKKVPTFSVPDKDGRLITPDMMTKPYRLYVFWASWCPHCTQVLPELLTSYTGDFKDKTDILAVSLDHKKEDWQAELSKHPYNWYQVSELKGWDGKMVGDFHIYATPTMILTDREGTILAKPITMPELRTKLREMGLL
ncbi:MAG: redoxin domain-containing protein [Lentimicrobiaceae bacterium]|nr:redoxin domain-containing protein [Lentimicrobiaceae bacterium]